MADKISFELVSPERLLLSEEADMVTLPGAEGDMGVMAGHMPLVTTLRPGVIDVKGGSQSDRRYFVLRGFAEVNPTKLTVLAEEAIPMAQVDAAVLDQRIRDAEEDILQAKTEGIRAKAVETANSLKAMRAGL
ncbi:MAG: F0F1 ATP synthase subunit epsilon [Proteobacteria bacterium]|nr:F0F1 ATP synthase subunit epsilon [Pseudomonadota bacterium]